MDVEHVRKTLLMVDWLGSKNFGKYTLQRLETVRSASIGEPDYIARDNIDAIEAEGFDNALDKEILGKLHTLLRLSLKEHNTAGMRRVLSASLHRPMIQRGKEKGKDIDKHLNVSSSQIYLIVLEAVQVVWYWNGLWRSYISGTE